MTIEKKKSSFLGEKLVLLVSSLFFFLFILSSFSIVLAAPTGPSNLTVSANETASTLPGYILNTSGGYITTINITARTQNLRWKAFVGDLIGRFALDDSSGSTIYDWSTVSTSGEVYAVRNSSTIGWSTIKCANTTVLEIENARMSHTNPSDNITKTFSDTSHSEFFIGLVNISQNSCPTLNTYVNNATSTDFEEVALLDGNSTVVNNIVYATILENNATGFDGMGYDFQMIVPENGAPSFVSSTAYYLYVELS